jgi:hypothetical protein
VNHKAIQLRNSSHITSHLLAYVSFKITLNSCTTIKFTSCTFVECTYQKHTLGKHQCWLSTCEKTKEIRNNIQLHVLNTDKLKPYLLIVSIIQFSRALTNSLFTRAAQTNIIRFLCTILRQQQKNTLPRCNSHSLLKTLRKKKHFSDYPS